MRNFVAAKQNFSTIKDLTFIILTAGVGRRFKSIGNKGLLPAGDTFLLDHQINIIKNKFPHFFDIIVVLGFEADKVSRGLNKDIRTVENELFETTNVSRSLSLGLKAAKSDNIFVIYGDIFFNSEAFNNFNSLHSGVAVDKFNRIENDKVGVIVESDCIANLAYGLPEKWGQINFVRDKELELLRKITYNRENDNLCGFEVFNKVLHKKGKLEAIYIDKEQILKEFNSLKDVQ
jgi:choline kinase